MKNAFHYKAWADSEILDAISTIDAARHPEQWTLAVRLMNHAHVVDRIFAAHLVGETHGFRATNTPDTPGLEQLRASISATDDWYQAYAAGTSPGALGESIAFTFTDGERGRMTREEMLFHVLAHGSYHRGNVGMILTACGVDRPKDTFTRFLHATEPERRSAP